MESPMKNYIDLSDNTQAKARATLRKELRSCKNVIMDDGEADAVIEQVWNALVGFPLADDEDREAA